jgi:hypothetical protein
MEAEIFKLLLNAGGLTIALAILFYYSVTSFKNSRAERNELKTELKQLQLEFHKFKDYVINDLKNALNENSDSLRHLTEKIETKLK